MNVKSHSVFIVLTHTGTVLSKCIKSYTRAEYTHASLSLDRELNELYSFGRKNPSNPIYAGFVKEDIHNGLFSNRPNTICTVLELKVSRREYTQIQKQIRLMKERSNDLSYSLMGLFGIMFNTPIERENAYFCSQFVSATLQRAGITLFEKAPTLTTPNDFLHCQQLTVVYEGLLKHYPFAVPVSSNCI